MSTKKRVLVVDDERNITAFLKTYLEDTGKFEVRAENSGIGGYEATKLFRPDLILLDVMMNDMSGGGLADKVKNDPTLKSTPIVFLTGMVTKEEVEANDGRIGGYPYLAKPILSMRDLLDCIEANIR